MLKAGLKKIIKDQNAEWIHEWMEHFFYAKNAYKLRKT